MSTSCRGHLRAAAPRVAAVSGLDPLFTGNREWNAQMAGLPLSTADGAALKVRLYDEHRVEIPIVKWKDCWLMRVSIQAYNSEQDVDALVAALEKYLQRWSPLREDLWCQRIARSCRPSHGRHPCALEGPVEIRCLTA
ncbi:hypothetical protein ACFLSF_01470 [Candidatus Bipolaricaulota bacterium]